MGTVRFSLVIATVDRTAELSRCLRSLGAQTLPEFEVVVVDQNLDERITGVLREGRELGLRVQHIRLRERGLSAARNAGIGAARGEVVGFPDDDCWYEPDLLERVAEGLDADPGLDGLVGEWVEANPRAGGFVPRAEMVSESLVRTLRARDASSITLFFRRRLLERLGGFDERLGAGRWYGAGEEADLMVRALALGARVRYWPAARVHHATEREPGGPLLAACRIRRRRERGTGALYAKHRLGAWVTLRGLVGPVVVPLGQMRGREAVEGVWACAGRLEGAGRWLLEEARQRLLEGG